MPRSQRYQSITKLVAPGKAYPPAEALALAQQTATTAFAGSIEVHCRLGINPEKGEQQVRGAVTLPAGTGQTKTIVAFVPDGREGEAQAAGADVVGGLELIDHIKQTSITNFDVAIATPEMMPKLAAIARILGPKGLMPSPKNETITTNLPKTIGELKGGKVNFKNDDTGNLHQVIGKASFPADKLMANFTALLKAVQKARPAAAKGTFIKSLTMNATMGPAIRVDLTRLGS